jgi:hypothetical protein
MAIFRAGKRIGPFDIRGGISRGDSKSSAYHKTDRDPRLKMQANTDNTIGRFRSAMASAEGYARPSRFAIRVFPPVNLKHILGTASRSVYSNGQVDVNGYGFDDSGNFIGEGFGGPKVNPKYMNDLMSTYGRQVNIHCDAITMPRKEMDTQEVQYGSEPVRSMVQTHTFPSTIDATFYADKYMRERQFFEAWQKMCVGEHTHKANYYDNYIGKLHIYQLGPDSYQNRDMPTYAVEAMEVYPTTIGSIDYSYAKSSEIIKITISFAYKYWRNMGSGTESLSFGRHTQAPANVKARNTGLLGMLPPELQRMGKDIFGQARTVWNPIGRIFKGKVFPPFT